MLIRLIWALSLLPLTALPAYAQDSTPMCVYNSSFSTLINGQGTPLQCDSGGNLKTSASVTLSGSLQTKAPLNVTPSLASGSISTVTSVSTPANTVEIIIMALDTNTTNLRVAFGATASASNGLQLQPGRSETFHVNTNVSLCPESGTTDYAIQFISQ